MIDFFLQKAESLLYPSPTATPWVKKMQYSYFCALKGQYNSEIFARKATQLKKYAVLSGRYLILSFIHPRRCHWARICCAFSACRLCPKMFFIKISLKSGNSRKNTSPLFLIKCLNSAYPKLCKCLLSRRFSAEFLFCHLSDCKCRC